MKDDKYVVFPRAKWEEFMRGMDEAGIHDPNLQPGDTGLGIDINEFSGSVVEDAVVIRKHDIFAGPAFHAYASSITTALEILDANKVVIGGPTVQRMYDVRDYFFEVALEADDCRTKKVPD